MFRKKRYIEDLLDRIEKTEIKPFSLPMNSKVEEIVGPADRFLKKLYTYWEGVANLSKKLMRRMAREEIRDCICDGVTKTLNQKKLSELLVQKVILHGIAKMHVGKRFGVWNDTVRIDDKGNIVACKKDFDICGVAEELLINLGIEGKETVDVPIQEKKSFYIIPNSLWNN